ncbi:MAG: metal-dependent hydrolase [Leptospiraceae bacterium]|nr:metal-dependent hydrolase [Leptospiraceae bacterium]
MTQASPGGQSKLTVRKPKFDFSNGAPRHWLKNSGLLTHVMNSLSLMFPEGERFFIRSVNRFSDKIKTAEMQQSLKKFAGQETQHGQQHDKFNALLRQHGYEYEAYVAEMENFIFKKFEPFMTEKVWDKLGLSITAAAEHMTATWAAHFLKNRDAFAQTPDEIKNLWLWHAMEEIEHKDFAFDVLAEVDDSYLTRIAGLLFIAVGVPVIIGMIATRFISQDKTMTRADLIRDLPKLFITKDSLGRMFVASCVQYLDPKFHPRNNDDNYLLEEYFAQQEPLRAT